MYPLLQSTYFLKYGLNRSFFVNAITYIETKSIRMGKRRMDIKMKQCIGVYIKSIMNECCEWIHRVRWNISTIIRNKKYAFCIRYLMIASIVLLFTSIGVRKSNQSEADIQQGIASEIIRFHVIANSDLTEDQSVKMKVKDAVIRALRPRMKNSEDINSARNQLREEMDYIQQVAIQKLREEGFDYSVQVSLEQEIFPIKVYGDITLPAGSYEALCIRLGEAQGHNWWCIVFPTLCYVDETYSYVPEESKEQLKHVLNEEEYESIVNGDGVQIRVKFKLWNYIKKYF